MARDVARCRRGCAARSCRARASAPRGSPRAPAPRRARRRPCPRPRIRRFHATNLAGVVEVAKMGACSPSTPSTATGSRASPRPCRTCGRPSRPSTPSARSRSPARRPSEHAALVVFPELGLSAYAIDDLLPPGRAARRRARRRSRGSSRRARDLLPVLVVGAPLRVEGGLFNCAVVIHRGARARRRAQELPARLPRVLREAPVPRRARGDRRRARAARARRSRSAPTCVFAARDLPGFALHVEICEDVWVPIPPSTYGALAGATVLANLSASNITIGKADFRRTLCMAQSARDDRGLHLHRRRRWASRPPTWPGTARR